MKQNLIANQKLYNEIHQRYQFERFTVNLFKRFSLAKTGMIPRAYQIQAIVPIMLSVLKREGRVFFVQMPRQSGKSQGLSEGVSQLSAEIPLLFSSIYPGISKGINTGVYGPADETAKMFTDKVEMRVNSSFYSDFLGISADTNNSKHIKLSTGSHILTHTASPNAKFMEGPDLDLAVIEEAQAVVESKITKSIEPMLAARNGTMAYIFSASEEEKEHGYVYYQIKTELERRARGAKPNPNFIIISLEQVFSTPGTSDYRRFVMNKIKAKGIEHPSIRSQYFSEWDASVGSDFMDMKTLLRCRKGEWLEHSNEPCAAGLDAAKVNDSTVFGVMRLRDRHLIYILQIHGDDYPTQNLAIRLACYKFNIKELRSENNGPQGVLNDMLEKDVYLESGKMLPRLDILTRTNTSDDNRDESFVQMKLKTRAGYFTYPDIQRPEIDLLEKQLCALVKRKVGNKIRIDHQNKRGEQFKSDYPDMLRLCLETVEEHYSFTDYINSLNDKDGRQAKEEKQKQNYTDEDSDLSEKRIKKNVEENDTDSDDDTSDGPRVRIIKSEYGVRRKRTGRGYY